MDYDKTFHLNVIGQLESLYWPLGPHSKTLFCRYDVIAGPDWELVSGMKSGVTQCSSAGNRFQEISFNMPIEFTYKSTNPFGWPQIVFSIYGNNFWGTETSRGNARIHVPLGVSKRRIEAPIITPKPSDCWSKFISWLTDYSPELRDPTLLANGSRTKGICTESYGHLITTLHAISRGFKMD